MYGFLPGGEGGSCTCTGTGPIRTGPNGCACSQCYVTSGSKIVGFGYDENKKCPFNGVDCCKLTFFFFTEFLKFSGCKMLYFFENSVCLNSGFGVSVLL